MPTPKTKKKARKAKHQALTTIKTWVDSSSEDEAQHKRRGRKHLSTILLIFSPKNLQKIILILSSYVAMSVMKINFDKSEVYTVGLEEDVQQQVVEFWIPN